jgi:TRAP-type C4-dicarboxylate transport system permease small subunit
MQWPIGAGGWIFAVMAIVLFGAAIWQVVQIIRWPEGKQLMRELDQERERNRKQ